jgi:hypothetical protein
MLVRIFFFCCKRSGFKLSFLVLVLEAMAISQLLWYHYHQSITSYRDDDIGYWFSIANMILCWWWHHQGFKLIYLIKYQHWKSIKMAIVKKILVSSSQYHLILSQYYQIWYCEYIDDTIIDKVSGHIKMMTMGIGIVLPIWYFVTSGIIKALK